MLMKLKHGFTTREEWAVFFNRYHRLIQTINKAANELLYTRDGLKSWIEAYKACSHMQRKMYLSHNQEMHVHIGYYLEDSSRLTGEVADSLLSYHFRYCTRMEDTDLTYRSACMLLTYYERRRDEIAVMKCRFILLVCLTFLDAVHFHTRCLRLIQQALDTYEKCYSRLSAEDQSLGLSIYDFMATLLFEHTIEAKDLNIQFREELLPAYEQGLRSYERFMAHADMQKDVNRVLPFLKINYMNSFTMRILSLQRNQLSSSSLDILYEMSLQALNTTKEQQNTEVYDLLKWKLTCAMCDYLRTGNTQELLQLIQEIDNRIPFQCNRTRRELNDIELNLLLSVCNVIYVLSKETKSVAQLDSILEKVIGHIAFLPSDIFTEYRISHAVYYEIVPLLSLVENPNDVIRYFMDLFLLRQPQTLIHTYMVAECSEAIMRALLDRRPQLLQGMLGCADIKEITAHARDFLDDIHFASLLHDVGKVLCTSVINTQYRKISALEFETIQFHPVTGCDLLEQIPQLRKYSAVAAGHHKGVDAVSGYPQNLAQPSSKEHLFTCIVTISDSLDAATDAYGRSYAYPKTFSAVLQEMKENDRHYAAELVNFIDSCEPLKQELLQITQCRRALVYEKVYHLLQEKQMKNEKIWQDQNMLV